MGCILTVIKFSLYLVHCRFQHFYNFICNCVCYTINVRFSTSLIHIVQSVAASRQGGRHLPPNIFFCPLIFFCSLIPPPLEYLAALKLFILVYFTRAVARALIRAGGGGYIHIFVFCSTNFF